MGEQINKEIRAMIVSYMIFSTVAYSFALLEQYIRPKLLPVKVQDVRFIGNNDNYRHYDYGDWSVYRKYKKGYLEPQTYLIDGDGDWVPDVVEVYFMNRIGPGILRRSIDDIDDWQIEQTYPVEKPYRIFHRFMPSP